MPTRPIKAKAEKGAAITANRKRKLIAFFAFQTLLPAIFIVGAWPLASLLWDTGYAFEKTFVTADLLLLGATLCLTITVELYCELRFLSSSGKGFKLDVIALLSLVLAVSLLFVFGVTKAKSFTVDFPSAAGAALTADVVACVWCSVLGGLFGVLFALWASTRASTALLELECPKK